MRLAAATLHPYALPLTRPWVAAATTLHVRHGRLLRLTDTDGRTGWGDCAPLPSSGEAGHAKVFAALEAAVTKLAGRSADDVLAEPLPDAPPEVRWAIETALFDLIARQQGLPLARLLGAPAGQGIALNAALGPLDDGCITRARVALAAGYQVGKIKVGVGAPDQEHDRLITLNAALNGRLRLRLDANRAWQADDAHRVLGALTTLPIDAIEEPLAAPTLDALATLQAALPFALAIDESLPHFGAEAILAARTVRRLVIKPARIGGIRATQALAAAAQAAGMDVVITSVVDSAIGVTAAAHHTLKAAANKLF